MIEQVKSGEKISAKSYNQLVDAVNGNVPEGHYDNPNQNALQSKSSYFAMFQVKHGRGYRMESRPAGYGSYAKSDVLSSNLWLYCGKDLSSMQKNVSEPDEIYIINEDNPDLAGKLEDSWFKVNGTGKTYDGWIDLQYKNSTDEVHAAFADMYEKDDDDKEKLVSSFFAISPKFDEGFIHDQLTSLIDSYSGNNTLSIVQVNPIYTVTNLQNKSRYDIEGSGQIYQGYQMHTGALERLSSIDKDYYVLYVDSELSDTELCSIQWNSLSGKTFIELFQFHTLSTQVSALDHPFLYDILMRKSDAYGNVLKYVTMSALMSAMTISGDADVESYGLSSIQLSSSADGQRLYQLYKFNDPDTDFTVGKEDLSSAEESDYKVLIRDGKTKQLRYAALSGFGSGDGDKATGDSNLTAVGLSSVQRLSTENDGDYFQLYKFNSPDSNFALGYYDVANLTSEPQYKILVRDDGSEELRYATLSGFDVLVSGDVEYTEGVQNSITLKEGSDLKKYFQLYNFDSPDPWDLEIGVGDLTGLTAANYQVLVRQNDPNGPKLRYACLSGFCHDLSGDANIGNTKSISSFINGNGQTEFQLYNFQKSEDENVILTVDYEDYYDSGSQEIKPQSPDDTSKFIIRTSDTGVFETDYKGLSIIIPPFVHGDSDSYVHGDSDTRSIESVTNSANPDKTYYQLYDWEDYSSYTTVRSDMLSDDYVDLATGTKIDEGNHYYQFLVRNTNTGDLEYKQVSVKGDGAGGWDEQRIINIENNIINVENNITSIYGDLSVVYDNIDALSDRFDGLSDEFWVQGGDSTNCYGTSIGNSTQGTVIGLDSRILWGSWTVEGNLTADNVYVDTALTCSELTATALEADSIDADSINCNGNFSCQSETTLGGNTDVFGTLAINNGNVLKIGNTTLSEAQLQALLALI